jgi:nitrous oxidase accessory protein NosD
MLDALRADVRRVVFPLVVLVMAAHEAEHVSQLTQQQAFENSCPIHCRGALGFIFDVEWVHFAYNTTILLTLAGLAYLLRNAWLYAALAVQAYHEVEHIVKLDQWFAAGGKSPQPGILGQELDLIQLHFALNTLVFVLVLCGFFQLTRRPRLATVVLVLLLAAPVGVAFATRTPETTLTAGVHQGLLVLDRTQALIGEPGAVVRGGIRVTADGVTIRGIRVVGGENGIEVDGAKGVVIDDVEIVGAEIDGINVRRSSVQISDCTVSGLRSRYAQGIDISFSFDLAPSRISGCTVVGGQEGIVSHFARVQVRGNEVRGSTMRGITVTEMSMGRVEENVVESVFGVGIFCGDYSECTVRRNLVSGTRPQLDTDDRMRHGYAIQAHFGANALVEDNRLRRNTRGVAAFAGGEILSGS